jgi:hypothetical protein
VSDIADFNLYEELKDITVDGNPILQLLLQLIMNQFKISFQNAFNSIKLKFFQHEDALIKNDSSNQQFLKQSTERNNNKNVYSLFKEEMFSLIVAQRNANHQYFSLFTFNTQLIQNMENFMQDLFYSLDSQSICFTNKAHSYAQVGHSMQIKDNLNNDIQSVLHSVSLLFFEELRNNLLNTDFQSSSLYFILQFNSLFKSKLSKR